jgi:hypothetical protein
MKMHKLPISLIFLSSLFLALGTPPAKADYDWMANDPNYSCYTQKDNWWSSTRYCHKVIFRFPDGDLQSWSTSRAKCSKQNGSLVWDNNLKTCRTKKPVSAILK